MVSSMLVIGVSRDLWMMWSVIVSEYQGSRGILVVVAVTKPPGLSSDEDNSFTDFQQGLIRKAQSDTEVTSDRRQDLLLVPLDTCIGDVLDKLSDMSKIFMTVFIPPPQASVPVPP